MMMVAALRRELTLAGVNLWQTGVRSLFKFYQYRSKLTQDGAWAEIRAQLKEDLAPTHEEWEYQEIRAVLYEEVNMTLEMAEDMYKRFPDSTPLIDAIKSCLGKIDTLPR